MRTLSNKEVVTSNGGLRTFMDIDMVLEPTRLTIEDFNPNWGLPHSGWGERTDPFLLR